MTTRYNMLIQVSTLAFGLLLLAAGSKSVVQSLSSGIETSHLVSVPLNLVIGSILVLFGSVRLVQGLGCLLFSSYCAYLVINLILGRQTCSCLGAGTSAKVMLAVDLIGAIILGFLWIKNPESKPGRGKLMVNSLSVSMLVGMLLIGCAVVGAIRHMNEPIAIVDSKLDTTGIAQPKAVSLVIENKSRKVVRIYGVAKSCQVVPLSDFPIELKPGQKGAVQIRLRQLGLGETIQYWDRGVIKMYVSQESGLVESLPVFWFLKRV